MFIPKFNIKINTIKTSIKNANFATILLDLTYSLLAFANDPSGIGLEIVFTALLYTDAPASAIEFLILPTLLEILLIPLDTLFETLFFIESAIV